MTALTHELLARLEAAAAGKLSKEDTKQLEDEIAQLPGGSEAAAEYRQLWAGLAALRSEDQRTKVADWEADWQDSNDVELIEWYLTNQLSAENRKLVDERLENDATFASLFEEQKALQGGLQALREERFRKQVREWGEEARVAPAAKARIRPMGMVWRRVVGVAAAVVFLLVVGVAWNTSLKYSDEALAAKYYKLPPTGNTMGADGLSDENAYLAAFADAHKAMQDQDYAAARLLFEGLSTQLPPESFSSDDLSYYQDNLDWNLVLALLGQGESGEPLERRLQVILDSPNHTYYSEAQKLYEDLNKIWR